MAPQSVDESDLALQLAARSRSGLVPLLERLRSLSIGDRYQIESVVASGVQGLVCRAHSHADPTTPLAVKLSLLEYESPAQIGFQAIRLGREQMIQEAKTLEAVSGLGWPARLDLVKAHNPLLPAGWGSEIRNSEPYLVTEWVGGGTFSQTCREMRRAGKGEDEVLRLALRVAAAIVPSLVAACERGYLFTDLKPQHIVMAPAPRLLDAGGLFPVDAEPAAAQYTLAFLPPDVYRARERNDRFRPEERWLVHAWGKVFLSALANREMIPGYEYRARELYAAGPQGLLEYIDALLTGKCHRLAALPAWTSELLRTVGAT